MPFAFRNLNDEIKKLMLKEIDLDIEKNCIYMSKRLNEKGLEEYINLLKEAVKEGSEVSLAKALQPYLNLKEQRKKPSGGVTFVNVPVTAAETLAEGEFNRFYVRAICCLAIESGNATVKVYRSKQVSNARSESNAKIGMVVDANKLLEDLRGTAGVDTALGIPAGPNSGLSVEFIL